MLEEAHELRNNGTDVVLGFIETHGRAETAAMISAERARGAAPDTIPAADLATSLNQMNERTMRAALSAEQPAVSEDHVVDTLAHIWVSSIYGQDY